MSASPDRAQSLSSRSKPGGRDVGRDRERERERRSRSPESRGHRKDPRTAPAPYDDPLSLNSSTADLVPSTTSASDRHESSRSHREGRDRERERDRSRDRDRDRDRERDRERDGDKHRDRGHRDSRDHRDRGQDRDRERDRDRHRDGDRYRSDRDRDRDTRDRSDRDRDRDHRSRDPNGDVKPTIPSGPGGSANTHATRLPPPHALPHGQQSYPSQQSRPGGLQSGTWINRPPPQASDFDRDRERERDRDRPLDRRAIEEGRRKREEERAREWEERERRREAGLPLDEEPVKREPNTSNNHDPSDGHPRSTDRIRVKREEGSDGGYFNGDGSANGQEDDEAEEEDEEAKAMAAMGFGGFGSTKGQHREGNAVGGADVKKQRTWRQYMNRRGGFNRPLDPLKEKKQI